MDRLVNTIITGDALAVLRTLPDNLVQTCITSPPYYGLRDYQTETILQLEGDPQDCQHVWIHEGRNEDGAKVAQCQHCFAVKVDRQIGLEETPEAYVSKLVEVFREVRRVLRDDGTCWINLGDSYSGSGKGGQSEEKRSKNWQPTYANKGATYPGLGAKQLLGIPWRVAFALQADGWILRSDIIWNKPSAMPESVTDRPTSSHEHIFLLAKSERYYYDAQAIVEPSARPGDIQTFGANKGRSYTPLPTDPNYRNGKEQWGRTIECSATRNKRNVWTIATKPYSEAHFATMPPKLIEPCILAGTSLRACEHCGSPWGRILSPATGGTIGKSWHDHSDDLGKGNAKPTGEAIFKTYIPPKTVGWQPTCSCSNEGRGTCIALDCFMGAGTTALVAIQHSRNYLGIELNEAYVTLAEKRIQHVQQHLWTGEGIA